MQNILRNVSIVVWGQKRYLSSEKIDFCLEFVIFFTFFLNFTQERGNIIFPSPIIKWTRV